MEQPKKLLTSTYDSDLKEVAEIIKKGGIVIFPTETVYGIGASAFDENAIRKIYEIKKRPLSKPISLLVSNTDMINQVAQNISTAEQNLINNFFPGPLTIILQKKDNIPNILSTNGTIGVRMPDNIIAQKLIEYSGVPLATTSANISGEESHTNISQLVDIFGSQVDYFIDGGESKIGIASTVVQIIDNKPKILREGSITLEQITAVI